MYSSPFDNETVKLPNTNEKQCDDGYSHLLSAIVIRGSCLAHECCEKTGLLAICRSF